VTEPKRSDVADGTLQRVLLAWSGCETVSMAEPTPHDQPGVLVRRGRRTATVGAVLAGVLALGAAACGGEPSNSSGGVPGDLDGRQVAIENGCAACHGSDGQGGVGPTWIGLAGSTVELDDGSTVVADTDYLTRAIVDPAAEIRPGWSVNMPQRTFEPGEVEAMVEYIQSLG